jgi:hypothetical protein
MMKRISFWIAISGLAVTLHGQSVTRRATITGSRGGNGKCTIEVVVDGVAEVEVAGEMGQLHTLSGTPANWVRFECSDPLPRLPEDFRFSGVDGRGRQILLRDPRGNRGVAVIRIEDPKGGREGYTFDIEWHGFGDTGNRRFGEFDGGRGPGYDRDGRSTRAGTDRAIAICEDAVRARVERDYGYRNLEFARVALDDNPGRRDWVVGRFIYRRGFSREEFEFSCSVDFSSGRVRSVELRKF